jgi:hypothetical protein
VSQEVWHVREQGPSLPKASISAKHTSEFAALSPMVVRTTKYSKKITQAATKKETSYRYRTKPCKFIQPVRIWVRIGTHHLLGCRKRLLTGAVFSDKTKKNEVLVTPGVAK